MTQSTWNHPKSLEKGLHNRLEHTKGLDNRVKVLGWYKEAGAIHNKPKNAFMRFLQAFREWL